MSPFEEGRVPSEEDLEEFKEPPKKGRRRAADTEVLYSSLDEGGKALLIYTGNDSAKEATARRSSLGTQLKENGINVKITQKTSNGKTKLLFEKVEKDGNENQD